MWLLTSLCALNLVLNILTLTRIPMLINTNMMLQFGATTKQDKRIIACLEKLDRLELNLYRIVEIITEEEKELHDA